MTRTDPPCEAGGRDEALSVQAALLVRAEATLCYRNAILYLLGCHSARPDDMAAWRYVEGVVRYGDGFVTTHGWLRTPDGTVVDPTVPCYQDGHTPIAYYPVVDYTCAEVYERAVVRNDDLPLVMTPRGDALVALIQTERQVWALAYPHLDQPTERTDPT